ncbi:hypothetical protein CBL_07192 [Carabus blaptoides fortunei]
MDHKLNKKRKVKGGAEKLREKKRKTLLNVSENCQNIKSMFEKKTAESTEANDNLVNIVSVTNSEKNIFIDYSQNAQSTSTSDITSESTIIESDSEEKETISREQGNESNAEQYAVESSNSEIEKDVICYFKKPHCTNLEDFFKFHPKQPCKNIPFSDKIYTRKSDLKNRQWLTFCEETNNLFCSICLAYGQECNIFQKGMSDWKHIYQNVERHEKSKYHDQNATSYFIFINNLSIDSLIPQYQSVRKEQILFRREVLKRIIDVVKLIGKQGLSYRGKRFEACHTLQNLNVSHECISKLIKKQISQEIKNADIYSIQIDTTQDITIQDQCSIIVRYVGPSVQERLLSVVNSQLSTGQSFYELVKEVLEANNLDIHRCIGNSTDGAANMQGKYKGFSAWLAKEVPDQIHIWCYAHILNLVISDITQQNIAAASLFGLLNTIAVFIRESYQRMNVWDSISNDSKRRKLAPIGETRWWAKESALIKIFGNFGDPTNGHINTLLDDTEYDLIVQEYLPDIKLRKKKRMFDEKASDEPILDPIKV